MYRVFCIQNSVPPKRQIPEESLCLKIPGNPRGFLALNMHFRLQFDSPTPIGRWNYFEFTTRCLF